MNNTLASICAASLLLLNIGASRAQSPATSTRPLSQPRSQSAVPLGSSAYGDLETLRRAGIRIDYGNGDANGGSQRVLTRDAFAAAVARGLGDFLGRPDPALQTFYNRDPNTVAALIRLVDAFQPELKARGVDTLAARRRFAALTVPWNFWEHQELDRLRNVPIVLVYDNETRPPMTRQELARITADLLPPAASDEELPEPGRLSRLAKLVIAFDSELRLLGVNVAAVKSRLAAGKKDDQLRDAAGNYRADKAMEVLRQAGILIGYPDETPRPKSGKK